MKEKPPSPERDKGDAFNRLCDTEELLRDLPDDMFPHLKEARKLVSEAAELIRKDLDGKEVETPFGERVRANPDEHPLSETKDYDERQVRYRMLAYEARHNLQLVLEQADALYDRMTVQHLTNLRDELNALDLGTASARAEAIDERSVDDKKPEDLH